MNNRSETTPTEKSSTAYNIAGWLFGILVLAMGVVNTFWGNDPGFGIFLVVLSLVYFPPANALLERLTNISVPMAAKILLGIFIIWAALGVGELFDKIDLMLKDL